MNKPNREMVRVSRLGVVVKEDGGERQLLRDVDFSLREGEIHGLVGESGCGKSLFARCLVRLEAPARIASGSILIDGAEVADKPARAFAPLRGKKISLLLQNPASAMDPLFTMASQFKDALSILPPAERSMERVYRLLEEVGISSAPLRCRQYPHQWSRGMLQRAQLVMALLANPQSLILDEVTSALDATIALQLIELIAQLRRARRMSFMLITHDLAMAAYLCDRISVMRQGAIVESGDVATLFSQPQHPYTRELIAGMDIGGEDLCPTL